MSDIGHQNITSDTSLSSSSRRSDNTTTPRATARRPFAQEEYEARLKQILELDSSDEEHYKSLITATRKLPTPPPPIHIEDLDLDLDFDFNTTPSASDLLSQTATRTTSALTSTPPQGHSILNGPSSRIASFRGPTSTTASASAIITILEPENQDQTTEALSRNSTLSPSPPIRHLSPTGLLSPSLTATSSISSVESSSKTTITRAASIASNSSERQRNLLHAIPSPPREGHFLHQSNHLLYRKGGGGGGVHHPSNANTSISFSSISPRPTQSKRSSLMSSKMNGQQSTSSRTGSRHASVNGLQSITSLEQQFNELRIPELELINTPESTIKAVLADIYKISEELQMHLQGGPLADHPPGSSRKEVNGIVISDGNQRQKRIKELLERISRETSLYEEFVKQSSYLDLDAILNETTDPEEDEGDELAGFDRVDKDTTELESTSDLRYDDTLSQASFMSNNTPQHLHLSASMSTSPVSHSYRSAPADPLQRLRLHPHRYASPGSVASSSFTGRHSRASSASFSFSELNRSDSNTYSPGIGMTGGSGGSTLGTGTEPWETFRWTPLIKLSDHLYSEEVKASMGLGTCIAVSNVIAVGTSRGTVLVYNGNQGLVGAFGTAQYAVEHGSVCSVAISSDHNYVVAGHSLGSILVWNLTKPPSAGPSRVIPPVNKETALSGRKVGHLRGSAVLHVHFVGIKHNEIASADDQGMAFHHLLYKVMMVHAVETTRLLGKYPPPRYPKHYNDTNPASPKRSTIFGMSVLPYGQVPHPADHAGLVALLTPFKMLIMCIKPKPQTLFKYVKPKEVLAKEGEAATVASGSLAWLPAMKSQRTQGSDSVQDTPPMLACSWNRHLYLFQVLRAPPVATNQQRSNSQLQHAENGKQSGTPDNIQNSRHARLDFVKTGDWMCRDNIVGIQWVKPQILLLLTNAEEVIVFDPRLMCETERCSIRSLQVVYHDWFKDAFKALQSSAAAAAAVTAPATTAAIAEAKHQMADMSYNNSWRVYKSKLFILGVHRLQVGTILNWTDRILALVKSGDFLEGIALATLFYTGKSIQAAVVGLPEDEATRYKLVGEKIYELLIASLNYSFNPERMQDVEFADNGNADDGGGVGAGTVLFHDLAIQCIESCLAMGDQGFLFDEVYERYAEAPNKTVKGIFLQSLEPYILRDKITEMPPQVMQAFVRHYSDKGMYQVLEECICHTPCHVLEMDQIVDLCQQHRLYTALIYVWNKSIGDYVSPVVELLKVIKKILKTRKEASSGVMSNTKDNSNAGLSGQETVHSMRTVECISDEEAVRKLYKYLADCLLGRSFTDGSPLGEEEALAAKESLYSFIFSGHCVMWPKTGGQLIITGEQEDEIEPTYPYLRLFLRHDCEEFLKVLDMAFEDSYLNDTLKTADSGTRRDAVNGSTNHSRRNTEEGPSKVVSKQVIINTLLEVFTPAAPFGSLSPSTTPQSHTSTTAAQRNQQQLSKSNGGSENNNVSVDQQLSLTADEYTARDFAHLYSFVARNYAKSTKSIVLSPTTLHRILTRLSSDTDPSTREERQVAAQALLRHYSPGDDEAMMQLYEKTGFYRVLEKMYRAQKQYGPWVMTFLNDPDRQHLVFSAIQKLLGPARSHARQQHQYHGRRGGSGHLITEKQRTDVVKTVMDHIAEVVDIDGEQAALLVHKYLNAEHQVVLRTLHGSKPRLFAYLRGLLEPSSLMERRAAAEEAASRRKASWAEEDGFQQDSVGQTDNGKFAMDLINSAVNTALENEEDDDPATMIGAQAITDPEMHETYIELMCEYDPTSVYDYLERHQDNSYRLDKVLVICEKAGVVDAVVWILERSGNVNGALTKVLEIVQDRMNTITALVASKPKDKLQDAHWSMEEQNTIRASLVRLRGVLNVGKQLCERSSKAKLLQYRASSHGTRSALSSDVATGSSPTSNSGSTRETETLWFRLLQTFVTASRKITLLVEEECDNDNDQAYNDDNLDHKTCKDSQGQSITNSDATSATQKTRHRGNNVPPSGSGSTSGTTGAAALSMIENAPPALFPNTGVESQNSYRVVDQLVNSFKGYVQSILTTLLLSTSTPQVSLPSLLRRLIQAQEDEASAAGEIDGGVAEGNDSTSAATSSQHPSSHSTGIRKARFADFREIFVGMLDTYKYEGQLLEMTNNLFERDLFLGVRKIVKTRAKGWRPRKRNCEICGGAFWGPEIIRDLWVQQQRATAAGIKAALASRVTSDSPEPTATASSSASAAANETPSSTSPAAVATTGSSSETQTPELSAMEKLAGKDLILFRCGHGYHRKCLEMETQAMSGGIAGLAANGSSDAQQQEQQSTYQEPSNNDPRGKAPIRNTEVLIPTTPQSQDSNLVCAMCSGLVKGPRSSSYMGVGATRGYYNIRQSHSHRRRSRRRDLRSGWEMVHHP
ncbi:Vacuolar protein sorting-associated protein 8 [Actinomortierella wolfii]|nr:Vacuolar protein sorting-associated protein 8 [Actinomortierella wolfii]